MINDSGGMCFCPCSSYVSWIFCLVEVESWWLVFIVQCYIPMFNCTHSPTHWGRHIAVFAMLKYFSPELRKLKMLNVIHSYQARLMHHSCTAQPSNAPCDGKCIYHVCTWTICSHCIVLSMVCGVTKIIFEIPGCSPKCYASITNTL